MTRAGDPTSGVAVPGMHWIVEMYGLCHEDDRSSVEKQLLSVVDVVNTAILKV